MFGLPVSGVTPDQQHNAGKLPLCLTRSSAFRASIFHQLPSRVHKTLLGLSKQAGTHTALLEDGSSRSLEQLTFHHISQLASAMVTTSNVKAASSLRRVSSAATPEPAALPA